MKPRSIVVLLAVVAGASVCVRLGFWQISRLHEKQALNAALRSALAAPPVPLGDPPAAVESVRGRAVEARGHYDETRQILLSGRAHDGAPGVDVVTPLLLPDGSRAVLVDRGWLYSADAATARPRDYPERGDRTVRGIAEPIRRGAGGPAIRALPSDSAHLWSARWLDLDSLERRFPYSLAPYVVRQLPGSGVPRQPVRREPRPFDEMMHVSYAVQWFLFAAILLGGSAALAWSRRGGRGVHGGPI